MSQSTSVWNARLDRIGVWTSAACFVHCLVMPFALSLLAVYAHMLPTEEHTHRLLAVMVTAVGALSIGFGYRRHRRRSVLVWLAFGLALIGVGACFGDRLPAHWVEVLITLSGSCCLIAAHRKNHTFCGRCRDCSTHIS